MRLPEHLHAALGCVDLRASLVEYREPIDNLDQPSHSGKEIHQHHADLHLLLLGPRLEGVIDLPHSVDDMTALGLVAVILGGPVVQFIPQALVGVSQGVVPDLILDHGGDLHT